MNVFSFTSRIGKDAVIRFLPNGDPLVSFSAAVTSGYGEKEVTTWINCTGFGKRYEAVAPYLLKGTQVAVTGELTNREYTDKDGNKRYSLDVRVNDLTLIGGKSEGKTASAEKQKPGHDAPKEFDDDDIPF